MFCSNWLLRAFFLCAIPVVLNTAHAYQSPVETPSIVSSLAARGPLLAIARAGNRLVAVGLRGHIVYSDDDGKTWTQAQVPVSSDLLAVTFPSPRNGWATGHDGVILHSSDGGMTWAKQLDGNQAAKSTARYYSTFATQPLSEDVERAARQAKALASEGNTQSFLDIRFENESSGFVVGAFNRIFRTEDGGKNWVPWMDRTENPQELHFYSIASDGLHTYLTGESGMLWKLDPVLKRFLAIRTSYNGTLFGLLANGNDLLAYGMRGSLLRSSNAGATWEKLGLPSAAGISAGVRLADGRIALATQAGEIQLSNDQGRTFQLLKSTKRMPYYGIALTASGKIAVTGAYGVVVEKIP